MSINLKQSPDGSAGLEGVDHDSGGFIVATAEYNASSVDKSFFVANRAYRVVGIRGVPDVAGTDAGAVTATIRKVPSGTALASGTALHSGTYNLKGTVVTNQTLTLSTTTTDLNLAAGDRLAIDFTGTLTAATGCVSVTLSPK